MESPEAVFRSDVSVELVKSSAQDSDVVWAARVSTIGEKSIEAATQDAERSAGLIRYLMRDRHGCYDDQTEVLTGEGWKAWPDVDGTETFATLSRHGEVQYHRAERLVAKQISGPMISIRTMSVDLLVTPDHNMLAKRQGEPNWQLVPAKDLLDHGHLLPMGGASWIGLYDEPADVERLKALGSHLLGNKLPTADENLELLVKHSFATDGSQRIPRIALDDYGSAALHALLATITGYEVFRTSSWRMAGDVQELAMKLGRAASVSAHTDGYTVTIHSHDDVMPSVGKADVGVQEYDGMVYCVTVPNGTLYVRRNGKPLWCGNTPFEHNSMTFQVTAPIFVFREFHRHRVGWCVSGDTEVWCESLAANSGRTLRKRRISDLYRNWHIGVPDSMGRTRLLASCRGIKVRTLDEDTGLFVLGKVAEIYSTGQKECLELTLANGRSLTCTPEHALFTADGWVKAGDLHGNAQIAVNGKRSTGGGRQYPPALRAGIGVWTSMQRSARIRPVDQCYLCGEWFAQDDLVLDHVVPVVENIKLALDVDNLGPACMPCHRLKTNSEQRFARRPQTAGARFSKVATMRVAGMQDTYDLAVEGPWHNYMANGMVVHNSYNEESGRYRELNPVFYVPAPERRLVQEGKPGAYVFVEGTPEQHEIVVEQTKQSCQASYDSYQEMLKAGVAREVARGVLPVATYSSMYATCNARSLMAFLSLRTKREDSTFPSFPQREIEMVAEKMEAEWAKLMPITYEAFNASGRVSP